MEAGIWNADALKHALGVDREGGSARSSKDRIAGSALRERVEHGESGFRQGQDAQCSVLGFAEIEPPILHVYVHPTKGQHLSASDSSASCKAIGARSQSGAATRAAFNSCGVRKRVRPCGIFGRRAPD